MIKIPSSFDVLGNVVILKFKKNIKKRDKKKIAESLIKEHKNIRTVLEKKEKFKGRLRKIKTGYLAGEKTKEVLHKENNCLFRFNIDETYFSPRLSNERAEIAKKIKKNKTVLVLFSGIGPYAIVIAKNTKAKKVIAVELNKKANNYAEKNLFLNKIQDKVIIMQGDVKKIIPKIKEKFDYIVVPRPNLKDLFLKQTFAVCKKNTLVFYYFFAQEQDKGEVMEKIKSEAKKIKKKIKILNFKRAGEIAPYKFRYRVDFKII